MKRHHHHRRGNPAAADARKIKRLERELRYANRTSAEWMNYCSRLRIAVRELLELRALPDDGKWTYATILRIDQIGHLAADLLGPIAA